MSRGFGVITQPVADWIKVPLKPAVESVFMPPSGVPAPAPAVQPPSPAADGASRTWVSRDLRRGAGVQLQTVLDSASLNFSRPHPAPAPAPAPIAGFTAIPDHLCVTFTDTSLNDPTSWSWLFGDGNSSAARNPTHCYATPGTYTVSITAMNTGGSGSYAAQVVAASSCAAVPFTLDFDTPTAPGVTPAVIIPLIRASAGTIYSAANGVTFNMGILETAGDLAIRSNPNSSYIPANPGGGMFIWARTSSDFVIAISSENCVRRMRNWTYSNDTHVIVTTSTGYVNTLSINPSATWSYNDINLDILMLDNTRYVDGYITRLAFGTVGTLRVVAMDNILFS